MSLKKIFAPAWISWTGVALLVVLCGVLAALQYRWIGEVAQAERTRLRQDLDSRLNLLRQSFNDQISSACYALIPDGATIDRIGREQAYQEKYQRAPVSNRQLVRSIALALPDAESLKLDRLDSERGWSESEWPVDWSGMRDRLQAQRRREPFDLFKAFALAPGLLDIPRFGPPERPDDPGSPREREWLIVDLNLDYIRDSVLPAVLTRYLGVEGKLDYDAEVIVTGNPSEVIYSSSGEQRTPPAQAADASVPLLDIHRAPNDEPRPGPPPPPFSGGRARRGPDRGPPPEDGPPPRFRGSRPEGFPLEPRPIREEAPWLLIVHHHAGSLEAIVAQARTRNLALSGAILLLILAIVVSLLRLSRQRHQMAESQMNFVAGVSHELRTPLTVIRTAAFNLRGKLADHPDQVERYGRLIQEESEKLTALVESVLRYGSANAGRVIGERKPIAVETLLNESLRQGKTVAGQDGLTIEKHIDAGLPPVLADEVAMRHAIQNLIENAMKHGDGGRWVGVYAAAVHDGGGSTIEIRVADHGPGIPREERDHVFDPFFRGRRAVLDQVHGTGLGLNLLKKIVEAHGGTIEVKSEPMQGAEFIIRIPAAPPGL